MVRTITHEDANVADAESLLDAGALDNQIRTKVDREGDRQPGSIISAVSANREPIFKLAWAGFPDQLGLRSLIASQGTDHGETLSNATVDYAERGETLLVILGGQSPGEVPGISILQFPAYQLPIVQRRGTVPLPSSESMSLPERYAFRDSLAPTGSLSYPTKTPPEDFILLPRSNPYFGFAHDPIAIIITFTPDAALSHVEDSSARGDVEAWAFPPGRSSVIPPSPGRKNYIQPGEGEKIVAMTPAPILSSTPHTPQSSAVTPGWRLPWSSGSSPRSSPVPSPTLRTPNPDYTSGSGRGRRAKYRRRYHLPSALWTGGLSVLGCEVHSLPTPVFKRLIKWSIDVVGHETAPRLPLLGGMAVPDLQSHGAPDVKVAKLESYRVLLTFHPDATVRFWDASPHILLLPTPLRFEYPGPLPHLTFSVGDYLKHPEIAHLPLARLWETDRSRVRIKSVHLAREALELIITFATGEIMVSKFGEATSGASGDDVEELDEEGERPSIPRDDYFPPQLPVSPGVRSSAAPKDEWVEEVTEIGHLASSKADGFKPVAIFTLRRGEAVTCAVSDIGMLRNS